MTIYVPPDKEELIDQHATRAGLSRSAWIVSLIDREISAPKPEYKAYRFNMKDGSRRIIQATNPAHAVLLLGTSEWSSWREVDGNSGVIKASSAVNVATTEELFSEVTALAKDPPLDELNFL